MSPQGWVDPPMAESTVDRSGPSLRMPRLSPVTLADRLGVSVAAVVFGLVGVVAAAVGGWWALRAPPGPDPADVLPVVGEVSVSLPEPEPTEAASLVVHVAGAVKRPGVHELPATSRVMDAVWAAGGFSDSADESRLNLAEPLSDGARVWVPSVGEDEVPTVVSITPARVTGPGGGSLADGVKVNVNTADAAGLEALPGIGPSLAGAIVEHRTRLGPFANVEQLSEVPGIGAAKVEQLRPHVEV